MNNLLKKIFPDAEGLSQLNAKGVDWVQDMTEANRIYELLRDMTHRLLTSNERHTRTILRELLPSIKENLEVDEIYIYEANPYVSPFNFFNRGISTEEKEKEKAFSTEIEKLMKLEGVRSELFLNGHITLQIGENHPIHLKGLSYLMAKYQIKTLLIKSFWEKETFTGSMIFTSTQKQKKWEEDEIAQLRTIKEIVFAALAKYKNFKNNWLNQQKINKLNQSLEKTNKSLEETNNSLEISLKIFSHDVRGKLSAILTLSQMMSDEFSDDETKIKKEAEIKKNIGWVNVAANEILNMADLYLIAEKAKMNNIVLDEKILNLEKDLISSLMMQANTNIASYKKASADRNLSIRYEIDPNCQSSVALDQILTMQILENLIANAIKYSKQGEIKLHVSKVSYSAKDYIRFKLTDCGSGISAEDIKKIFEPGYQVDKKSSGVGLGLSFVYKLVKAMKGNISVESNTSQTVSKSPGSTFTVDIPYKEFLGQ